MGLMIHRDTSEQSAKKVLNVGGGNKNIRIPDHYNGYHHFLLDIDSRGNPDIICDARELTNLPEGEYDSVYCSHNLEHYYRHDVLKVLKGFYHVLKRQGFADIRVPDLDALMKIVVQKQLDIDDFLYQSPAGPIMVRDVIYGYGLEIEQSANDYYAHKTGFTPKSLSQIIQRCGFRYVFISSGNLEARALAFKMNPTDYYKRLFNLPTP